jgi:hypothetical protein
VSFLAPSSIGDMVLNPSNCSSGSQREMPVWLPWLVAPAFALLPMAGCGVAATLRQGAEKATPTFSRAPPLVAITAVVTAVQPGR